MTTKQLLYLSKPPLRLGGKDSVWEKALMLYNLNNEEKVGLRCHSDYLKVKRYAYNYFKFDPAYYEVGPSGLSPAAKDEIRQIFQEEIKKVTTITLPTPVDEDAYKKYGILK